MSAGTIFALVRLIHVVTGTIWVGGAVLVAGFLAPAILAAGPAGASVMRQLTQVYRLPYVLAAMGVMSILTGAHLWWVLSAGSPSSWMLSGSGRIYTLGGICAVVAALIGIGINIPTANRIGALAQSLRLGGEVPSPAQADLVRALSVRLARGTRVAAILLIVATSAMAVARYVA
jgi:hypothetical protein